MISVILLPDTESAIVVLANSLALNDTPHWVGQLDLEEVLKVPDAKRNDFVQVADASAAEFFKWYPTTVGELQSAR